jgi:hypothetical protein
VDREKLRGTGEDGLASDFQRRGLNLNEGGWVRWRHCGLIQGAHPALPIVDSVHADALGPAEGPWLQSAGLPCGKQGTALRN